VRLGVNGVRWKLWIAGYAGVVALFTFGHMSREPYDDGHFFQRVARHALDNGSLAWNVDEGPAYGSTSQLFQWLALPMAASAGDYYMSAMRGLAALSLVAAFAALLRLTSSADRGLMAALAFTAPTVLYSVLSGMETALVFALLCVWLLLVYGERGRHRHWALAPALTLLVYSARPDALLLLLPPLLIERSMRGGQFQLAWRELLLIGAGLVALLAAFHLYYGTALPLPFYAKHAAFSPYDEHFRAVSRQARSVRFGVFAAFAAPGLLLALAHRDRTNLVLLASVAAFCTYHFVLTIEVMGMQGRFYAPAVPLIAFAASRGVAELAARSARRTTIAIGAASLLLFALLGALGCLPSQSGFRLERVDLAIYLLSVPALALACVVSSAPGRQQQAAALVLVAASVAAATGLRLESFHVYSDEEFLVLHTSRYTVYRGLDTLRACFGDAIHVYHSEVGVPGLRFQHGKVTDLAGLLSREWLFREPQSFDTKCARDRPQAIFLPHKNYHALNSEIASGTCLAGYTRMVESSSSPLFVRADLAPRYRACARERADPYAAR
jgi:hypothetical protein